MNLKGQPAHVGRHCGASEYEVTPEVVAFYREALGEELADSDRFAPPLLHHSECYKHVGEWYLKNLFGNLHGQQDWWLFAPIPVGDRVRTRSTIVDRYHKRGRDYVVNEVDLASAADGRLLVRGRTHQSFLPPKRAEPEGFVVDQESAARKASRPPFPTATGEDLEPVVTAIDEKRCWMFSGPGRNYHTDADQAKKLGFPTIVVQGMMSTCFVSHVMQKRFGEGWLEGGRMSVKLTNVIWVDETITTRGRIRERLPEGPATRVVCEVWGEKDDGTRTLIGEASALER